MFLLFTQQGNSSDPYDTQHWNGDDDKAIADDEGLHISNRGDVHHVPDEPEGKWVHWPTLAAYVGPGFLVCIAYLDPGNLEADLQVQQSWLRCKRVPSKMGGSHLLDPL